MVEVVVCICTCRRPEGLTRLLRALAELDFARRLAVVVVENDAGREGLEVCQRLAKGYRWPLTCVVEEQPGIAFARNHAVRVALAQQPRFIAMLDDDEWPSQIWLSELLRVQAATDADVVGGPVLPVFPANAAPWSKLPDYYGADQRRADGERCLLYSAANFLAHAQCFQALMPTPFDPRFAHTGEDIVFFRRLAPCGYRMHWSTYGIVYETVAPNRLSLAWLQRRYIRTGHTNVIVQRLFSPGLFPEAVRLVKTSGLLTIGAGFYLLALPHRLLRIRASLLLCKAWGKILGHLGYQQEYREHGG